MAAMHSTSAIVVAALILAFGIIHLGVGIGVVARYRQFGNIFQQSIGLSAYNIIIGFYGIVVGILSLVAVIQGRPALSKSAAVCSGVLGIFALVSLITALALNSQAINFVRSRLLYNVDTYSETDNSVTIVNALQTKYQCCGVNLWLDWGLVDLGTTSGSGVSTGTGTNTGTIVGTNTNTGSGTGTGTSAGAGRRRRHSYLQSSPLVKAVRQRRQLTTGTTIYGLPSTYTLNLPLSCCTNGGVTSSNTVGGYCSFNAGNNSINFYEEGCIGPVSNVVVSQITGIAVINICMAILAFVLLPILMRMFPATFDPNNPHTKKPLPHEMQHEQQVQNGGYYVNNSNPNGGYYMNNSDPNAYYAYIIPPYTTYQ